MIWSLVKILAFVAVVMAATLGATMLLDMEGSATIDIGGKAASFSVIEMVIGLIGRAGVVGVKANRASHRDI
jgi:HemY protein